MPTPSTTQSGTKETLIANAHPEKPQVAWLQYVVHSSLMQAAGIMAGDLLTVQTGVTPQNGQWVVLRFGERLVIRRLEQGQGCFHLVPLHQKVQPMEWPVYEPLPLVGVVRQVIRTV